MTHNAAQVSSLADARAVLVRVQYRATDMARDLARQGRPVRGPAFRDVMEQAFLEVRHEPFGSLQAVEARIQDLEAQAASEGEMLRRYLHMVALRKGRTPEAQSLREVLKTSLSPRVLRSLHDAEASIKMDDFLHAMSTPSHVRVASRFLQSMSKSLPPFRVGDEVDIGRDPLKKLPRLPSGNPTPEFWTSPIMTGIVTRVEPEAAFSPYGSNPFVTRYTVDFTDAETGESHEFKISADWWSKPTTRREPIDLVAADVANILKKNGWAQSFKRTSSGVGTPRGSRVFEYTARTPQKGPMPSAADLLRLERERAKNPPSAAPQPTTPPKDNIRPSIEEVVRALSHGGGSHARFPIALKKGHTLTSTVPSGPNGETKTFPIEVRGWDILTEIVISPF